jgi:hypothetical protein
MVLSVSLGLVASVLAVTAPATEVADAGSRSAVYTAPSAPESRTSAEPGNRLKGDWSAPRPQSSARQASGSAAAAAETAAAEAAKTSAAQAAETATAQALAAQKSAAQTSGTATPPAAAAGSTSSPPKSPSVPTENPAPAPAPGAAAIRPSTQATGTWLSGAAGTGVATGEFGTWRGTPVEIAGTWAIDNVGQVEAWALQRGAEYGSWNQSVDIAIGAIGPGESWSQAAKGSYDGRWRQALINLRNLWAGRPGTLYIRFAHEMNGNWYPWAVNAGNHQAFIQGWNRFRALQQEIFPASELVFCLNSESIGSGIDWRKTFPGAANVDVIGIDHYNGWPNVTSPAVWNSSVTAKDGHGAPKGLQAHLDFARSVGLPLSVPEWSGKASAGDSPVFIQQMNNFFRANAGGGAGQLLYEIQFNIDMHGNDYRLFGGTRMPSSATAYRDAF